MLSDAPGRYKSNSNLIRSIPSPSASNMHKDNSRNSLTIHLGKHRQRTRTGKVRDNRVRPRHGGAGSAERKRRHRRRNRLWQKKCQDHPEECGIVLSSSAASGAKRGNNVDLVRSLDRRSSVTEAAKKNKNIRIINYHFVLFFALPSLL